jgi:hypothetical protein
MINTILVFNPNIGKRLRYLIEEVLPTRFINMQWEITDNLDEFLIHKGFKLNYSELKISETNAWVHPEGWLTDGNWRGLNFASQNQGWVMFPQTKGDYAFDVFSAIFTILTRAEEYLVNERDEHGRFSIHSSGFPSDMKYTIPWVDVWLSHFAEFLSEKGIPVELNTQSSAKMTIDVDNVTAVYGKPLVRQVGGAVKHFKTLGPITRIKSASNIQQDPFYSFPMLKKLAESSSVPFHFFLLGGAKSDFDKNQAFSSKAYVKAISEIKQWAEIGLHPSYYWHKMTFEEQQAEKHALEQVLEAEVSSSRMHFLKFDVRTTYLQLEALGIVNDYTLGFADGVGFRAGTAHPFKFYSLAVEREVGVICHPFVAMDATLNWYLKMTPESSNKVSLEMANYVKSFGGCLSFLWHNDTANGYGEWSSWKSVFEYQLNLAKQCLN